METPVTVAVTEVYRGLRLFRRTGLGDVSYRSGSHRIKLVNEDKVVEGKTADVRTTSGGIKQMAFK